MHLVELIFAGLVLGFLNTVSSGGSVLREGRRSAANFMKPESGF